MTSHPEIQKEIEARSTECADLILGKTTEPWDDDMVDDFLETLKAELNQRMGNW